MTNITFNRFFGASKYVLPMEKISDIIRDLLQMSQNAYTY